MNISNKVQLIAYPDGIGSNLKDLEYILKNYLQGIVAGVHILPFYPSNGDRGFSPLTHLEVDPKFGDWDDIARIAKDFEVTVDLIVNHVSTKSKYFQDFLTNGKASKYADMFITFDKFDPSGQIDESLLQKVYRRKPKLPYQEIKLYNGEKVKVWQTFGEDQIDIDINSPITREVLREYIDNLAKRGVKILRLDAVAYTTKKLGTRSFFEEPEIWEFMEWVSGVCEINEIELLPEVHYNYHTQQKIANHGYWAYDFSLPIICLHALYAETSKRLKHWLEIAPHKQFVTLDTHDGLGVVDVEDLLTEEEIYYTKDNIFKLGGNATVFANDGNTNNLDVYQVNCTYYSALGQYDQSYLLARAIQFFTPGIPQIYYIGLIAGENDLKLVEKTKNGRDINRKKYSVEEFKKNLHKPVTQKLFQLIKFRNTYPAFNGKMEVLETPDDEIRISWKKDGYEARLEGELNGCRFRIYYKDLETDEIRYFKFY
ncbi:MAG: sucrose phosphorylase [Thermales bacterium]|nr:sucrose phosphorylase [Thermales bacterium]